MTSSFFRVRSPPWPSLPLVITLHYYSLYGWHLFHIFCKYCSCSMLDLGQVSVVEILMQCFLHSRLTRSLTLQCNNKWRDARQLSIRDVVRAGFPIIGVLAVRLYWLRLAFISDCTTWLILSFWWSFVNNVGEEYPIKIYLLPPSWLFSLWL